MPFSALPVGLHSKEITRKMKRNQTSFHATQQGLQTFLPAVLLFFQMVVLTLQLFALMLGILNFLRQ